MEIILSTGLFLLGLGIFGAVRGYGTEKRVGRFLNLEVANFGLMLIFLDLYEALALLAFAAATVLTTLVFMRLFLRMSLLESVKRGEEEQ